MPEYRVKGEVHYEYDLVVVATDKITARIEASRQVAASANNTGPYSGHTVHSVKEVK